MAYLDCLQDKRNTASALAFRLNEAQNLFQLLQRLLDGTYQPGPSICFVVTHPKAREVWAADFPDRIVHHLLYNRIAARFHASFIHDSCACIPGRGTLYAARRVEHHIRSITQNWSRPAHYLKCDLANFFVRIDKHRLREQLVSKIPEPWWRWLADTILFHDPRENVRVQSPAQLMARVPPHKSLFNAPDCTGLPIGNLSSQFFANVHLNALDQFAKHHLKVKHYARYVDDFVLLHESPQWLNQALAQINEFLPTRLGAQLNPKKTILQPIDRGVDFVGHVIKPWRRTTRRKTVRTAMARVMSTPHADLLETANSYFGLLRQATHSHHDRAQLANLLRDRGHTVKADLTKTYRATRAHPTCSRPHRSKP